MLRQVRMVTLITLVVAIAAGPAWAQVQSPPAPAPAAPSTEKMPTALQGTVKKVDPASRTVKISSGLLGIFGKTLEVTTDTQIQVEGRQATLSDIHEGSKVKASYETRDGKNIARMIEVMPPATTSAGPSKY